MRFKFYKVGSIIKYTNNIKLEVVKVRNPVCTGCYFSDYIYSKYNNGKDISCITHKLLCIKHLRPDNCSVIFRRLSE